MSQNLLLLVNLASTLMMTGVIWFVQLVHYPLFGNVGASGYCAYQAAHSRRTTYMVAPPMLIELGTSGLLVAQQPTGVPAWQTWLGLGLVGTVWLSTFALQVPRHNTLGTGYDPEVHRTLVATNWLRTTAWTARALLVLWMTSEVLSGLPSR
jgi:hypothetical protein